MNKTEIKALVKGMDRSRRIALRNELISRRYSAILHGKQFDPQIYFEVFKELGV